MEQTLIFALNILALGTYGLENKETLVVFTLGFLASRLIFFVGYIISMFVPIPARATGFLLSWTINALMMALNVAAFMGKYDNLVNFIA
jgi:uncharacterized membrane protein YecN with MAPEG domain